VIKHTFVSIIGSNAFDVVTGRKPDVSTFVRLVSTKRTTAMGLTLLFPFQGRLKRADGMHVYNVDYLQVRLA
jgi:hypothetical protein